MTFGNILFGENHTYIEYLVFLIFTLLGMILVKLIAFNKEKQENPDIVFNFKYWIKDNYLDFAAAFIMSFVTLRFLLLVLAYFPMNLPIELPFNSDKMIYGFILGLTYQYTFRRLLKYVQRD